MKAVLSALVGACLCAGSALAAPLPQPRPEAVALAELQALDTRIQTIGWRLANGNARFCADAPPAIGLLLQDMAAYGAPDAMRSAAGIAGDIAVQAVAAGSPAEMAGLKPNTEILAIGGSDPNFQPLDEKARWRRLKQLHALIATELRRTGAVELAWRDATGRAVSGRIPGVPACATRFELLDGTDRASADGERIVIGRDFPGLSYAEDEFAAALAHELAHNLLGHRAGLAEEGRSQRAIRATEDEADRLMPWLLANAGYDPGAAQRFMQRWGPKHGGGLFRTRTHRGWDERADAIAAELPLVLRTFREQGAADWSARFQRRIVLPSDGEREMR